MAHLLKGNGRFDFPVVGESFHQDALLALVALAGGPWPRDHEVECIAALVPQDENEHDNHAIAVAILRQNGTVFYVGHLSRSNAREYRASAKKVGIFDPTGMLCRALIVGGDPYRQHLFGVRLDLIIPIEFRTAKAWENWKERLL